MKPSWDDAPPEAMWLAEDRDGLWWWHWDMPKLGAAEWSSDGRVRLADDSADKHWESSLEPRP